MDEDQIRQNFDVFSGILQSILFWSFINGTKLITWTASMINKTMASENWLATTVFAIVIIVLVFKAIDMAIRSLLFWVRFFFKFGMLIAAIAVMLWVYNRGADGAYKDALYLAGYWKDQLSIYQQQAQRQKGYGDAFRAARDAFNTEQQHVMGGQRGWPF